MAARDLIDSRLAASSPVGEGRPVLPLDSPESPSRKAAKNSEPIMTVLFDIRGAQWPIDDDGCSLPPASMYVQLSNTNARDFLDWIGLGQAELTGEIQARELTALL